MPGLRRLLIALATALCSSALAAPAARADITVYPDSMAATGASATTAFNTCPTPFTSCPANSWSTGTEAAVESIYLRIAAVHPAILGHAYNDAIGGRKMAGLQAQVEVAAEQRAELVTVDMGSNDVCTPSEETMTSVASFEASFNAALRALTTRRPSTAIAVLSIPNVHRLWRILHENAAAVRAWDEHTICQSMLANATSTARADAARRERVLDRIVELNGVLASVCARYAHCRYDGGTTFGYAFEAGEVTTRDYFHPSIAGQATIARVAWELPWEF